MATLLSSGSPPPGSSRPDQSPATGEARGSRDQPRIRRRNRLITSCMECRRRKLKCDKKTPICSNCYRFNRHCVFISTSLDPAGQAKLAEVKEKMGELERALEENVARRGSNSNGTVTVSRGILTSPSLPGQEGHVSDQEDDEDVRGLEVSDMVTEDAAYFDDEGNDEMVDLGISLGKLRITERVGGFVRPRFSEELSAALKEMPTKEDRNPYENQPVNTWMAPGPDYVAPSSSFFFAPGIHKVPWQNYLPEKATTDKLMEHYWKAVHIIARTLHKPSFEEQYRCFWQDYYSGREPRVSFQAVLFAALLSSAASMSEERARNGFGRERSQLVEDFRVATEIALSRAHILRTTKLETLQAFVMYLIPLCRSEVSRAHSALTGTCIRLAECMGLHRDPTNYTDRPVDIHIRRLIWYQICFLDLRTCESTGPRPQIRREEHDTKFPLNVNDEDLLREVPVTEDRKQFTDMTITRIRFECYEMQRLLWTERPKIEAKKTTLTSVLGKIRKFCAAMNETYGPLLDKTHPLGVLGYCILNILSSRMYIMILQRFLSNDRRLMPDRLRELTFSTGLTVLENSMTIEQTAALADWAWYIGALNQYHTALLLLAEMHAKEQDPRWEARLWRSLDFVFELPAELTGTEKTRVILGELASRTAIYQQKRGIRAPAKMGDPATRSYVEARSRKEEHEEQIRRGSFQSARGSFSAASSSSAPPSHPHGHVPEPQHVMQIQQNLHIPSMQAPSHVVQQQQPTNIEIMNHIPPLGYGASYDLCGGSGAPTPQSYVGYSQPVPGQSVTMAPQLHLATPQQSIAANAFGGMAPGPLSSVSGQSPPELEIDWNEYDQVMGGVGADMATTIMMPPNMFPQFTEQELMGLQWPNDGMH